MKKVTTSLTTTGIGLTGNAASGKSTASKLFAELGAGIIDADAIARQLTAPGTELTQQIIAHFGDAVTKQPGKLDRAALANRIFCHPDDKRWLEQLLHPPIRQAMHKAHAELTTPYCLWVIPLLAKSDYTFPLQRVCVIDVSPETQQQRLTARHPDNPERCAQLLAQQPPRETLLALADDVIENSGNLKNLRLQIEKLHHFYSFTQNE